MEWETVIGLEVHVQLATNSKIFSGASTAYGAAPNTQACAIDLALPGTLPSPNEQAFRYAIMFGLAIDAEIGKRSVFERKNYFYPDLPKGYQTTQLESPIVGRGHVEILLADGSSKSIRIHHAHLEEDAGKSLHEDFHGMSGIDLNRAGTPLIEIVSEPDMRNSAEAVAFARKLHSIVTSLGICDGEMSQGSMRFDVNVSVRPKGSEEFGTRTETKNLNSFKFMEEAIALEVERQIELIEDGGKVIQETRLYNGDTRTARSMRSKEEANDYRYFPCPDLLPVVFEDDYIDSIRQQLPELPDARQQRFMDSYKLSAYDADILSADADTARFFEATVAACQDAKLAANWVMGEVSAHLNNDEKSIRDCPVSAEHLAGLINRIKDNTISNKIAKQVFESMWQGECDADTIIEAKGLKQMSDSGELEKIVADVIAANPAMVEDWLAADESKRKKKMGGFMGPIMKATKGQANPGLANQILSKKLNALL
ncbi:Asp-tRNA(Asn)/Glu-tRNA(Gln) amidotransferase subunit GatB [Pseudomaricurvus alcaniphilus]|uniref:Asp-tRNA(Asn)/Glu-tRNA(Gln) amidotransferase subunit GatB n=1 Tax=Pseudomaricurvus alcaniphilus TaxID=1166482 RepID=UPI0014084419|nr:Asp-tRNA(Asn)/Glu-tRNA(Gln) amidotransferase subunit GatB [Pseudomaricurvus alcaniphilus]NHN39684.1 Asp-tRNA(Asn)/Glu-tRNA(Gln) amidotransferase subunit GatB [Pseudomaricurvus alcaniphilus]